MKHAEAIFKMHNIKYVPEKRFKDCVNPLTGRLLPFDYYCQNGIVVLKLMENFTLSTIRNVARGMTTKAHHLEII